MLKSIMCNVEAKNDRYDTINPLLIDFMLILDKLRHGKD